MIITITDPQIQKERPEFSAEFSAGVMEAFLTLREKKIITDVELAIRTLGLKYILDRFSAVEVKEAIALEAGKVGNVMFPLAPTSTGKVTIAIVHAKAEAAEAASKE